MNDRELLEMAAKAGGIARSQWDYEWVRGLGHMVCRSNMWNPLTDDGDALRLAVRLRMRVQFTDHGAAARIELGTSSLAALDESADVESAARLAIVRAAAEIGRSMP